MPLAAIFKRVFDIKPIATEKVSPSVNVMSYLESVGVVESPIRIRKRGRIRLCGVYWFAYGNSDRIIAIDEEVRVVGRSGTTLIVEPMHSPKQLPLCWPENSFPKSC